MSAGTHVETVNGTAYHVDEYPADWRGYHFLAKVRWIEQHTRPRPPYRDACAILSAHSRAVRAARKRREAERQARRTAAAPRPRAYVEPENPAEGIF